MYVVRQTEGSNKGEKAPANRERNYPLRLADDIHVVRTKVTEYVYRVL
jgi:hypothetical protein